MSGATFGYRRETRLPHATRIVYQGLEGAYSNLAAVQVFRDYEEASFSHVKSFDAAVRAVDEGTGDYAVIPIENSTAGSVDGALGDQNRLLAPAGPKAVRAVL